MRAWCPRQTALPQTGVGHQQSPNRRPSRGLSAAMSKSRTMMLVATLPPAAHAGTSAFQCKTSPPKLSVSMAKSVKGTPHQQKREDRSKWRRRRCWSRATHGTSDSRSDCGLLEGVAERDTPAPGPLCDLIKALWEALMVVMTRPSRKSHSHGTEDSYCQLALGPRLVLLSSLSGGLQAVGQCSPLWWFKSVDTCHCCLSESSFFQTWGPGVILQSCHDHVRNFRVSFVQHPQTVSPTGPKGGNTGADCTVPKTTH